MQASKFRAVIVTLVFLLSGRAEALDTGLVRAGDKLKITFFETMELPDIPSAERRSSDSSKLRVFYQRVDLSGEFAVEANGMVSIPILGSVEAAGKSTDRVRESALAALEKATGRAGNASVAIIQRQPVFVAGAARNPGSYAYFSGMIAAQALALAGGPERDNLEFSQTLSMMDRKDQSELARDRQRKALARKAIYVTLRDGGKNTPAPPRLVELAGAERAAALIASERDAIELRQQAKQNELAKKQQAAAGIREEVAAIQSRLSEFDNQLKSRADRLQKMESLFASKVIDDERVTTVRRDYLDLQGRQSEFKINLTQAANRLSAAETDLRQAQLSQRAETEAEMAQLDDQIAEGERSLRNEQVMALAGQGMRSPALNRRMEILRVDKSGPQLLDADDMTELFPGDVLKVGTEAADPGKPLSRRPPAPLSQK
jgi:protein involved in polysaccharide export with SLBB domain